MSFEDFKLKIKNFAFWFVILIFEFYILNFSYAAPCYGTKMPQQKKFFTGAQAYTIFKRYLEDDFGKLKSMQNFYTLSYGVFDWFCIDLKAGGGDIRQRPVAGDKADYPYNFAGGYGLRLRLYDAHNFKMVFGFQHISVHTKSIHLNGVKNKAILDDWQTSLLVSYDLKKIVPYLGTRWSRIDYIHRVGQERKRRMSDLKKSWGFIFGLDLPIHEKVWINLEGSFFDSVAAAASINFKF